MQMKILTLWEGWEGLRFVIVALPGLFSYLFCIPPLLCLCRVESLESLPVHSFDGVIISKCQSLHFTVTFRVPLPHDSNLVFLVLRLPRLGKRELILVLFVYLFVSSSSWDLGRAAVCDCGTPWTFLLPFFAYHTCCVYAVWRP